jgi:AraC-like DNA-binding protein
MKKESIDTNILAHTTWNCKYNIKNYASSELSVKDIATAVGFNDYCYFSRSFKKYVGQSPAFYFKKWKK